MSRRATKATQEEIENEFRLGIRLAVDLTKVMKPCPFCGQDRAGEENDELEILVDKGTEDYSISFLPTCKRCDGMIEKWFDTPIEAVEAWNRRAGEQDG